MPRIPIIDRANMNADQARVYDAAKAAKGPLGGPYYAYIRIPKLFEAAQNLRATLASGPLSRREHQVVNLTVARHWGARYPWFAQVRGSLAVGIDQSVIDAINARGTPNLPAARERTCFAVARELLASKGAERRDLRRRGKGHGAGEPGRADRGDRRILDDLHDRQHVRHRAAGGEPHAAEAVAQSRAANVARSLGRARFLVSGSRITP